MKKERGGKDGNDGNGGRTGQIGTLFHRCEKGARIAGAGPPGDIMFIRIFLRLTPVSILLYSVSRSLLL